tara:strand:+ start:226 stop:1239 length:1014 start_codon:yes stop_codon:yes gene_type:complete
MKRKKLALYHFIISELKNYSDNVEIIKRDNPLIIKLEGKKFSIWMQDMNPAGAKRDNINEGRTQISRKDVDKQKVYKNNGYQPIFLGFFLNKVFQAWDPEPVLAFQGKTICSLYAPISNEKKVIQTGPTYFHQESKLLAREVKHPVLKIDDLCIYLLNHSNIHHMHFNKSKDIQENNLQALINSCYKPKNQLTPDEKSVREKLTINTQRTYYPRDPKFTKDVLEAYDYSCAICGRQMGIIEAAHIIPHGKPDGNDEVSNGIALCVMHHKLYDKEELIFIDIDNQIIFNDEKIDFYKEKGLDRGLDEILQKKTYSDPNDKSLKPSSEFIEISKKYRLD